MEIVCYEHDKGFVVENFRNGEFDYVDAASEVEECEFFRFIGAKKYLKQMAESYPSPRKKEEVPTWFYIASNLSMRLHGVHSFNAYPYVIRCGGMLNAFGPEVAHKVEHPETKNITLSCSGFNAKNDYDRQTPCDQDFLRKFSKDTFPEELEHWFNHDITKILKAHKVFDRDGIFIGDASYIFVPDNENYEGSVRLLFDPSGHPLSADELKKMPQERAVKCEWKRCYKMVSLLHTDKDRSFTLRVAVRVVPGNEHESPVFYDLLEKFIAAVGDGVIKRLILDRGFIDGEKISNIKRTHAIDVLIPLKKNMDLYRDVMGMIEGGLKIEFKPYLQENRKPIDPPRMPNVPEKIRARELKRQETLREKKESSPPKADEPQDTLTRQEVAGVECVSTWNSCPIPVQIIVNRDTYADGHEEYWMLLDTKPFDSKDAPTARRKEYEIRVEIEEGHRQLKCFWDLTQFTSRAFSMVLNQIIFVLLAFNMLQIWLKTNKKNTQDSRKSRTRLLNQLLPTQSVIIIYYKNHFATLAAMEYTELLLTLSDVAKNKILEKTRRLRRSLSEELRLARPS